jgi:hypothetical protein
VPFAILAIALLGLLFAAPPTSFFVKRRWLALWTVGLIGVYAVLPFVPREAEPFGSGGAATFVLGGLYLIGALINVISLVGRYLREAFGSEGYQ